MSSYQIPRSSYNRAFAHAGQSAILGYPSRIRFLDRLLNALKRPPEMTDLLTEKMGEGFTVSGLGLMNKNVAAADFQGPTIWNGYKEFFAKVAPVVRDHDEASSFVTTARRFIESQEAYDRKETEDGTPALFYINPFVTLNVTAAVVLDIYNGTKKSTGDDFARTGMHAGFSNPEMIWHDARHNHPPHLRSYLDDIDPEQCEIVLRKLRFFHEALAECCRVQGLSTSKSIPDMELSVVHQLQNFVKPFASPESYAAAPRMITNDRNNVQALLLPPPG